MELRGRAVEQAVVALHLNNRYCGGELEQDEEGNDDGIWPEQHERKKLESSLWQNLPSDLLFSSVLVRLSFPCLLRLHSVSRSWRSRLSSSAFWHSWFFHNPNHTKSSLATQDLTSSSANGNVCVLNTILLSELSSNPRVPHLLLCTAPPHASVHGLVPQWVKHKSVKFIRSESGKPRESLSYPCWRYLHENFMKMQKPYSILACEKGLLLLALHGAQSKELVVCNPLLQERRVLPMPDFPLTVSSARFFVDGDSGHYVVLLPDCCQSYHSKTGKWQEFRQIFHVGKSGLPPLLDGSIFWVTRQKLCRSDDVLLSAYHPKEELVTYLHTQFPHGYTYPKHGIVWKDSQSLQTVTAKHLGLRVWKLDNGLWKTAKTAAVRIQAPFELSYVKIGNLLLLNDRYHIYVFNFDLEKGAWAPNCPFRLQDMGYCAYQPSYFEV